MDIEKKDLKEVKKDFNKIERVAWIYFEVDGVLKKAWYIKCDDAQSYVLVRYPNGPFKKLMIEDGGIYLTKSTYKKYFSKTKSKTKSKKKVKKVKKKVKEEKEEKKEVKPKRKIRFDKK